MHAVAVVVQEEVAPVAVVGSNDYIAGFCNFKGNMKRYINSFNMNNTTPVRLFIYNLVKL